MKYSFFNDQLGRVVRFRFPPKRIISLVPSQTELLFDLGLTDEVVGITRFCVHPHQWHNTKTHVGGTKNVDFEKIKLLKPDLIIGNKEENNKNQIEQLMKLYPVWMSDIQCLSDAINMMVTVGEMVNRIQIAKEISRQIDFDFNEIIANKNQHKKIRAAYFIWRKPFMVAGKSTFINDIVTRCGFENVFASDNLCRYPTIAEKDLQEKNVDLILLSSEPFPFKAKHVQELKAICPDSVIRIVDGEMFSWYGSRLLQFSKYFLSEFT